MDDAVCIINIGPKQRRRRRDLGIGALAVGAAVALAAVATGHDGLLVPSTLFFLTGFSGVFQARAKT